VSSTSRREPTLKTQRPGLHAPLLAAALERFASNPRRAALALFTLSLAVQSLYLARVPERLVRPHTHRELQAVAVSLATTGRIADPYALPTGLTAHLPPIPPAIVGLVYRLFGVTLAAGYVAWFVDIATYAALWAMLPWVALRVGLPGPAGVLAGVAGGLVPHRPGHAEALSAVALGLLLVAFVQRWSSGRSTRAGSLLLGIAAGAAFHVQPALLPVVLGWTAFELWWGEGRRQWLGSALVALGILVACLPWGWRNYRAFHAFVFVRSNLGLELRMGNHDGAAAAIAVMDRRPQQYIHPRALETEARKLQQWGEVVYMRRAGREALDWIATNPGTFLWLTASRVAHWWLGPLDDPPAAVVVSILTVLALHGVRVCFPRLTVPQRAALLVPLVTYPLIYYVVAYMPRYREPVDWLFLLMAAAALLRWLGGLQSVRLWREHAESAGRGSGRALRALQGLG
jgi:hypothetical protein